MTSVSDNRHRVLFVDDDQAFLEMIQKVMAQLSGGTWEVLVADTAGRALWLLQENAVQLAVIDVQMPVVDGLQLLTILSRRHPNLQKVVLTGFATETYRAACLSNGADLFLEKPKTKDQQTNLYAALNEMLKWKPEEGFRGVLQQVTLDDVIQMECLSRNSRLLEITTGNRTGTITIRDGAIIHAEIGDRKGEEALNRLLRFRGGEFKLKPYVDPAEETLSGSWEFLLMEAARMRDEIRERGEDDTQIQTFRGESEPVDVAEPPIETPPTAVSLEDIPDLFPSGKARNDAVVPTEVESDTGEAAVSRGSDLALPQEHGEAGGASVSQTVIEMTLACNSRGEVIHDWQCQKRDFWINFLEFLSQKSRQAGQGLDLGYFERLEIEDGCSKVVVLILPDRAVLVRSREVGESDEAPVAANGIHA